MLIFEASLPKLSIFFFLLKIDSSIFLSKTIHIQHIFLSVHFSQFSSISLISPNHSPSISLQNEEGLNETSVKHDKTKYKKALQKPSCRDCIRQLNMRKSPKGRQESKTHLLLLLKILQKHQAYNHNMYTEDLGQIYLYMPHDGSFSFVNP